MQTAAHELRPGFTQIPNAFFCLGLTAQEKMVLIVLMSYKRNQRKCWPSQETLARDSGLAPRSVIRVLQSLKDKMIVQYQRRGYGRSNCYEFLDPDIDTMILRLLSEPAAPAQTEQATPHQHAEEMPLDFSCLLQSDEQELELYATLSTAEPLLDLAALVDCSCADESPRATTATAEQQIDPPDQIAELATAVNAIDATLAELSNANVAQLSSANVAQHEKTHVHEQDTKKRHTQNARSRAHVCAARSARSRYSLKECVDFAASLRPEGIKNPLGYGTAIWLDSRDDGRIAEWLEAQQDNDEPQTTTPAIILTGGYDPACPHCFGLGVRYTNGLFSDLVACCCNQRQRDALLIN